MSILDKVTAEQQLFQLLQSIFQPSELRRFLRYRPDYSVLCDDLPGDEVSLNTVIDAAIRALDRHGLITRRLFDAFLEERPHRREEIERVAAIWGGLAVQKEEPGAREFPARNPLSRPSGPLKFSSISIDASDPHWGELTNGDEHSPDSPFDRPCSQRFRLIQFVYGADPIFDITLLNTEKTPVILTTVGIHVVTACQIAYLYGIPQAAKIPKWDSYVIQMPNIRRRLRGSLRSDHPRFGHDPQDVQETVFIKLPDPIYLESHAPYRYGLLLRDYFKNIPNWARVQMWAATDQGECWSSELETFTL